MLAENSQNQRQDKVKVDLTETSEQRIVRITVARAVAAGVKPEIAALGIHLVPNGKPTDGFQITGA